MFLNRIGSHFPKTLVFGFQVKTQAQEIYDKYFRAAQAQPRSVVAKLGSIVAQLEGAVEKQVCSVKT